VLSDTWVDTYGSFLSEKIIQKVTSVWHDPNLLASQIRNPEFFFAVAKDERAAILGLATARKLGDDTVLINRLYVHPQFQRRGIGEMLLNTSISAFPDTKRVRLEVEEQNQKGLAFYLKQGFKEIGRNEENVEGETLKVVEMEKRISPEPTSSTEADTPNTVTNISGGVDLDAQHDVNIGGDVVGRDKTTANIDTGGGAHVGAAI
jgi:GNAT superfamily N-acetyltransferase